DYYCLLYMGNGVDVF
nr:immunoglobulin light chain junction region [Macaca mulatta]MOW61039.1 immunoglobulin light chain junction region [Macaca mulatta]